MKRLIIFLSFAFAGCGAGREFPEVKKLSEYKETDFVLTPQSLLPDDKNAVYSVPMIYAWQQIAAIGNGKIGIDTTNKELVLLNNTKSGVNALKEDEYTATASINDDGNIEAYAEFSKSLPFAVKLQDLLGTKKAIDE